MCEELGVRSEELEGGRALTREERLDADSCLMEFLNSPSTVFEYRYDKKNGEQVMIVRGRKR